MNFTLDRKNRIVSCYPANLLFFEAEDLLEVAVDAWGDYSDEARIACIAELLKRRYLCPGSVSVEALDAVFPGKEWRNCERLLSLNVFSLPRHELNHSLWQSDDEFLKRCESAVRGCFRELFERIEGFVPVYLQGGADSQTYFIPFHFEKKESLPLIGDMAGCPVEGWVKHVEHLFGAGTEYRCVLHCYQRELPLPLTGSSLMLPLWMAHCRKLGLLPQYNHLRLLATGEIRDKRLVAVHVEDKLTALRKNFAGAFLLFPESSSLATEERAALPLPAGMTTDEVRSEILQLMEAEGLVVPTFREAMHRLRTLEPEIREDNFSRWERMLQRLETNAEAIQPRRAPKEYLLCLMMKSAIHCHMGATEQALELNREAKDVALRYGAEKQLRRLEIEELVELMDQENFSSIAELMAELGKHIEESADDDLLMRYHGTMGQAHSYGALAGQKGFSPATALEHFLRALEHAYRLNSEPDIAQDLNYLYLWHALFHPSGTDAARAYREAKDHIDRNLQDRPNCRQKNLFFLQRLKLMALYRRLLQGEVVEHVETDAELLPEHADTWLRALCSKYLGAMAAARGDKSWAERCFAASASLLDDMVEGNMIIAYIRMTVLAEAYRSLGDEHDKQRALDAADGLAERYADSVCRWRNFLTGQHEFPGLYYWY